MSYLYRDIKSEAKGKESTGTKSNPKGKEPKNPEPLNTRINLIPTEKGLHPICHGTKCACNQ